MPSMWAFLLLVMGLTVGVSPALASDKPALGWVEKVRLYPGGLILQAKLDSGAATCSLNASNLTEFTRQGQKWVKFQVTNHLGQTQTFEAPVRRQMGERVKHNKAVLPGAHSSNSEIDVERAKTVLPLLARLLGLEEPGGTH